ncbi:peptidoglycan DD-metalloendopeptidase family protein [Thiohalophilus thiocyanatoxydans]|uniref:Peptidase M23-like protein n=1 Tax=Thiohalophilus thiocyanatoxydans TaxID=381308 RepID=A0A4R8IMR5_9GAMM|nr:peptidoglycan DD-metalloendopeptidase family protein [Thiohalophilus thiocyanatoxydans]TDY01738.1 peptidase M23-like protein [Thiohalophilus thiocyanatoxydans]
MNKPGFFLRTLAVAVVFYSTLVSANTLPRHQAIPGGVAIITLNDVNEARPGVSYLKKKVMVRANDTHWEAIVGIPLSAQPGIHRLKVRNGQDNFHKEFRVVDKDYKTTHITISDESKVSLSEEDLQRHYREKKQITAAINSWSERDNVDASFITPVEGRFSSPFGLKRIYNNQERIRRHTGLDIAAPVGTPIIAPASGTVIRTGDYFFTGNTVFIDHGQGLITLYCHLDKIDVEENQHINQSQKLGEVGMTGRVSGPHLHWAVFLNRFKVDPELFMSQLEKTK